MRKVNIILYVIILVLFFVDAYWVFQIRKSRKTIKELAEKTILTEDLLKLYEKNIIMQLRTEGTTLDISKIFKENGAKINTLESLKSGKGILVFRYSKMNCQTCIDIQLKAIKQILPENAFESIVFLAKYNTTRDMYQFKRSNHIEAPILKLDEDINPIDSLNVPYFFFLNKEGIIDKVFIPGQFNIDFTKIYLKKVIDTLY